MAVRKPIVRHFIACERIEQSPDGRHFSLINTVHALKPLPGASYPQIHPEIALFIQMSDGAGPLRFEIELVFLDDETSIYLSPSVTLDLGNDPLVVYGWPVRIRNLLLPHPGLFEFRLRCNGQVIAREPILLRESP